MLSRDQAKARGHRGWRSGQMERFLECQSRGLSIWGWPPAALCLWGRGWGERQSKGEPWRCTRWGAVGWVGLLG